MVQLILVMEEFAARNSAIVQSAFAQQVDIATRAKPAPFGMVEDDRFHSVIICPLGQCRTHRVAHIECERMQRLGAIEGEFSCRAFD